MKEFSKNDYSKFNQSVTGFILKYKFSSLLIALLIIGLSCLGLKSLRVDFSHKAWFKPTNPLLVRFESFQKKFGNDDNVIITIHNKNGLFNVKSISVIQEITKQMWRVSDVIRVDSLTNFNWIHSQADDINIEPLFPKDKPLTNDIINDQAQVAMNHEIIPGYLISKNQQTSFIFAKLRPVFDKDIDFDRVVADVKHILKKYENEGLEFYITGGAAVTTTFKESSKSDIRIITPLLSLLLVILLIYFLRSFAGLFIPTLIVMIGILSTLGIGGHLGVKINNLTAMVPKILLAIALADVIHILVSFFKFRQNNLSINEACQKAYLKNFTPTFLTSLSTAIGFVSLVDTELVPIKNLGLLAAIGTILLWVLSFLIIAPLLSFFAPRKIKQITKKSNDGSSKLSQKLTSLIDRQKKWILFCFGVVFIGGLLCSRHLEINSNPYDYFTDSVPLKRANDFVLKETNGVVGPEVVIYSGKADGIKDPVFLNKVERFQNWLGEQNYVNRTLSIIDILKQMNRVLHSDKQEFYQIPSTHDAVSQQLLLYSLGLPQGLGINDRVSLDNESLRLTILWNIQDSRSTVEKVKEIEAKLAELELKGEVTGKLLLYQLMNGYVVKTFFHSIFFALILITIFIIISFKSIKLGLLSMIPNIFPLGLGIGIMALTGKAVDFGTVIVASVCLGIGIDDTIHFVSNFNYFKKIGLSDKEAIEKIFTFTGPSLVITTLILVVSFGTFMFGDFIPNKNFGTFTAIILTIALIADLLLLPAILLLTSKKSKMSS